MRCAAPWGALTRRCGEGQGSAGVERAGTHSAVRRGSRYGEALTRALWLILLPRALVAVATTPGPVWTRLIPATTDEQSVGEFGTDAFCRRARMPAERAPSDVYLATSDSRFMPGEILANTGCNIASR